VSLAEYRDAPELAEVIGTQQQSPQREAANELERQRLVLAAEVAKAERRLHLALLSSSYPQMRVLEDDVRTKKTKLQQLTEQLKK